MNRHANLCRPVSTTLVLGAGFSNNAGLPTQAELSNALLTPPPNGYRLEAAIAVILKAFLGDVFGCHDFDNPDKLPSFEDIFTCIDLSANSGHQLGGYDPRKLRAIRRMAVHKVLYELNSKYRESSAIRNLLDLNKDAPVAFVATNWDIVLEKQLSALDLGADIDYCCDATDWDETPEGNRATIPICKMHGSANWLCCDKCKHLFYSLGSKLSISANAFLERKDFELFADLLHAHVDLAALIEGVRKEECRFCRHPLSSHIATFSYRKSFRTHVYPSIWYQAERLLADSERWVFIGYSLPDADYEFKHLLKTAQLRRDGNRSGSGSWIDVVYKEGEGDGTKDRFARFFGSGALEFWQKGLEEYVRQTGPAS